MSATAVSSIRLSRTARRRGRAAAALGLFLAASSLTACASGGKPATRLAQRTRFARPQAGFTPEQIAMIEDNCGPFGTPKADPQWDFGPTEMVIREGYVLQHLALDKIPLWVCEHATPEEVRTDPGVKRRDKFAPDPQLQGKPRAELADYKRSGFDRGHQAPAGDQNSSQQLKDDTFFLSNMVPQVPANNQQIWADLEHRVRGWVESGLVSSAFIVTGSFFYDPREEDPATADGLIEYRQIGPGDVSVPTHLYKIVFAQGPDEQWKAVAFVAENRAYKKPFDFAALIEPIDWLEERTGLDFLPGLDPIQEQQLEAQPGTLWDTP